MKIERKFANEIFITGLKRNWVATKIGVSASHLTNILAGRDALTEKHRKSLNKLLKTNY